MSGGRIKVLYIAGPGRSGSTLLGQILGQVKGFCFVGEVMYAWQSLGVRLCGCRAALEECDFWTAVRRTAGGGSRLLEARELFGLGRLARWRYMPLTFAPEPRLASRFGELWHACERLYGVVGAVSGAHVIVDSSKSAVYGRMVSRLPALDLHVVHLVRDSRAVAHSRSRLKPSPDRPGYPYMYRLPPARAAVYWLISNLGAELFCRRAPDRYLRLRYEDFIDRPRDSVERILSMVAERPLDLPFSGERTVELRPTHSVKGNPDRLRTGPIELRLDEEWRSAMRPADRRLVTALTWPLLLRYGYAVRQPR